MEQLWNIVNYVRQYVGSCIKATLVEVPQPVLIMMTMDNGGNRLAFTSIKKSDVYFDMKGSSRSLCIQL